MLIKKGIKIEEKNLLIQLNFITQKAGSLKNKTEMWLLYFDKNHLNAHHTVTMISILIGNFSRGTWRPHKAESIVYYKEKVHVILKIWAVLTQSLQVQSQGWSTKFLKKRVYKVRNTRDSHSTSTVASLRRQLSDSRLSLEFPLYPPLFSWQLCEAEVTRNVVELSPSALRLKQGRWLKHQLCRDLTGSSLLHKAET